MKKNKWFSLEIIILLVLLIVIIIKFVIIPSINNGAFNMVFDIYSITTFIAYTFLSFYSNPRVKLKFIGQFNKRTKTKFFIKYRVVLEEKNFDKLIDDILKDFNSFFGKGYEASIIGGTQEKSDYRMSLKLKMDAIMTEIYYDINGQYLEFKTDINADEKTVKDHVSKLTDLVTRVLTKNSSSIISSIYEMKLEFLKDENGSMEYSNKFIYALFKNFGKLNAFSVKFITENTSEMVINKNSIILKNENSAKNFTKDIKSYLRVF